MKSSSSSPVVALQHLSVAGLVLVVLVLELELELVLVLVLVLVMVRALLLLPVALVISADTTNMPGDWRGTGLTRSCDGTPPIHTSNFVDHINLRICLENNGVLCCSLYLVLHPLLSTQIASHVVNQPCRANPVDQAHD